MVGVEQWAELRREHFVRGVSIKQLVVRTGLSRNTVRAALRAVEAPRYRRTPAGSKLDPFKDEIHRLLKSHESCSRLLCPPRRGQRSHRRTRREKARCRRHGATSSGSSRTAAALGPVVSRSTSAFSSHARRSGESCASPALTSVPIRRSMHPSVSRTAVIARSG